MNAVLRDRISYCSAIALGLGVSTGHPIGIVAGAAMPFACFAPATRKAGFKSAFGYYLAALWPIIPGLDRYMRQPGTRITPIAAWLFTAIVLSIPWAIGWTSDRIHYIWRAPLPLLATVVPPLGVIGLASPLVSAGYIFPGTDWAGLAAVVLLPGIVLCSLALSLRRRCVVLGFSAGFCIGFTIAAPPDHSQTPPDWIAVNTHFGDVSQPFQEFPAAQFIQQRAAGSSARVLIFPEAVVPRWSEATEAFWRRPLDLCRTRGQVLAIGAGLPARNGLPSGDREKPSDLRSYDFGAALEVLKSMETSRDVHGTASLNERSNPPRARIDNMMLLLGAESAAFYQRVPVPIGMWQPFSRVSVPLRLRAPGVLEIDHQRAAVLICYEQLLTFPVLASMLQHPTVIVGISNTFWVEHTTIPRYQARAMRGWARLFRLGPPRRTRITRHPK